MNKGSSPLDGVTRRQALVAGAALCTAGAAAAQDLGAKTSRILVGFAAGGSSDNVARLIAQLLPERLGVQQVIVDNRPGANTTLAIHALKASPPDGRTMMLGTAGALVQSPGVQPNRLYDPMVDFTPVAMVGQAHGVLSVRAGLPFSSVAELLEEAGRKPGSLTYGSAGIGSASHLPMEYLLLENNASMVHVPFKGDNEVALELVAGRLDVAMNNVLTILPFVQQRKVRALATSSPRRLAQLPDVPTYAETGNTGLAALSPFTFYALMGPAGLGQDMVRKWNSAINEIVALPDIANRFDGFGIDVSPMSPEALRALIGTELQKWRRLSGRVKLG